MARRWPGGTFRRDVDFRIVEVLTKLARRGEARRAARAFLRRYPRDSRAPDLKKLLDGASRAKKSVDP